MEKIIKLQIINTINLQLTNSQLTNIEFINLSSANLQGQYSTEPQGQCAINSQKLQYPLPLAGVAIAGGVASNRYLRKKLAKWVNEYGLSFFVPPAKLCTDNAAMIAWAAIEGHLANKNAST